MARTWRAGSALVGPIMKALTPSSAPFFLMPASMALNHGMPPIFTTTPMTGLSADAKDGPARANETAPAKRVRLKRSTMLNLPVRPVSRRIAFYQLNAVRIC